MGSVLTRRPFGWFVAVALLSALAGVWIGRETAKRGDELALAGQEAALGTVNARVGEELGKRLVAMGHNAHEWKGRLADLAQAAGAEELAKAAFLMAPAAEYSAEEAGALLGWVEAGGTLFVAPVGSPAWEQAVARWVELVPEDADAAMIPGDRVVPHDSGSWRYRELTGEERVEFAEPMQDVAVPGPMRVADPSRENSILFPRDGLGLVAEIVVGDGNLIVFPEAGMFSDEGLASASNASLLASLVEDWVPARAAVWIQRD